jgi:sugar-specific transcriptional regulator TrmB
MYTELMGKLKKMGFTANDEKFLSASNLNEATEREIHGFTRMSRPKIYSLYCRR